MRFSPPALEQIPSVDTMVEAMSRSVTGLDTVKRRLALMLRRFMVAAARDHDRPPQNLLLVGPSGGGKTHLIRAALSAAPVIWTEANATEYSDVGYSGRDLTSMYLGLLAPRWRGQRGDDPPPWNPEQMRALAERWGVVVIDEFDKLRTNAKPKEGERQVGRALQAELLKLVEGQEAMVKRNDDDRGTLLNTHNVLHIVSGAFQGLNELVWRSNEDLRYQAEVPPNAYTKLTIHDLIRYGFLEELVGRFSTLVPLPPLEGGHLSHIFREHVVPSFQRQCADDGIELVVEEGAISDAGTIAAATPIGARALTPLLDDALAEHWSRAKPGSVLRVRAHDLHRSTCELVSPVAV